MRRGHSSPSIRQSRFAKRDCRRGYAHHFAAPHAYRRRHYDHLQARRPIRRVGSRKAQLVLARLAKTARNQDGSAPHRLGLGGASRERIERAHLGGLRLSLSGNKRHAPPPQFGRRTFQPAYARPCHGLLHSWRAARSASRHGLALATRRCRLLSDLGFAVRAYGHRRRSHVAAHDPRATGSRVSRPAYGLPSVRQPTARRIRSCACRYQEAWRKFVPTPA